MTALDEFQLNKLLFRLKDMTIYLPVFIAATTGMRLGEICGLTWDNVDLKNGVIYVHRQLQYVENYEKDYLDFVAVKTSKSRRKINLLTYTIDVLSEVKKRDYRIWIT